MTHKRRDASDSEDDFKREGQRMEDKKNYGQREKERQGAEEYK